jgi:hypothetical protein
MRTKSILLALILAGCEEPGTMITPPDMSQASGTIEVSGEIASNTTWTKNNSYVLTSHTFVTGGATLTIELGTVVKGRLGSSLVITRDGKINAVGTKAEPIVLTSDKAAGQRKKGDWGGLVLLGKAKINSGMEQPVEGFPATEARVNYGGTDDGHDCGKLKYVRIEFAGFEIAPGKEINSLTVGACGSATELDFIETHLGSDDGIEFFGGTANLKHAMISQPNDDGLDWDFGWSGKVQFVIIQQSKANGNAGYESDGNGNAPTATPLSNPTIYNVTMVGTGPGAAADKQLAMTLRRGTHGKLYNHIVLNFTDGVVDIVGPDSVAAAMSGNLLIHNSIFFGNVKQDGTDMCDINNMADGTEPAPVAMPKWGGCDDKLYVKNSMDMWVKSGADNSERGGDMAKMTLVEHDFFHGMNNFPATANLFSDPMLEDAASLTAPNFKPKAGSPALTAANAKTPPSDGFFDASATFIGAVGADDWTVGWTAYPEN